jgi:SnoaL-like domain
MGRWMLSGCSSSDVEPLASEERRCPCRAPPDPDRIAGADDKRAEGDAAVSRWTAEVTLATGQKVSVRGLTYYRLADGKIVEDDPLQTPELSTELEKLTPSPVTN